MWSKAEVAKRDEQAMARRDGAAKAGCQVCHKCNGTGEVWKDVYVVDGWSVTSIACPRCKGETWLDAQGHPYKID